MAMVQLCGGQWPPEWKPHGWTAKDNPDDEPFASWWERLHPEFPNLDPRVVEQWVYAHWNTSPYFGFPLQQCRCTIERLSADVLIQQVGQMGCWTDDNDPSDLDAAYEACSRSGIYEAMLTKGTWDMPVLLAHSASGFAYDVIELPQFPYWLLEGHRRHEVLRALATRREPASDHDVLVLSSLPSR